MACQIPIPPMNFGFLIFPMVTRNFQFSFKFFFLLLLFLDWPRLLRRRFRITHVVQVPLTSNISQKCLTFSLKYSRVGFGISVGLFLGFFHILLIDRTTPRKFFCQDIDPSVYEVNTDTKRK